MKKNKVFYNIYSLIDLSMKSNILNDIIYSKREDNQLEGWVFAFLENKKLFYDKCKREYSCIQQK